MITAKVVIEEKITRTVDVYLEASEELTVSEIEKLAFFRALQIPYSLWTVEEGLLLSKNIQIVGYFQ